MGRLGAGVAVSGGRKMGRRLGRGVGPVRSGGRSMSWTSGMGCRVW